MTPHFANIPKELTTYHQWVNWRLACRDGRYTKLPFQLDQRIADVTKSSTWTSFHAATGAYWRGSYDGVGFVLTATDPFVAFDFDTCLQGTNITDPRVADYVTRLNSYTEVTPSGAGLRVIVRATLPLEGRRKANLEVYDSARYVTLTGTPYPGSNPLPIADGQAVVNAIHTEIFAVREQPSATTVSGTTTLGDTALLEKARWSRDAARFIALYDQGDWQGQGFPSQSEADLWLASRLAFWTCCDLTRMERLFLNSALSRRKSSRADYLERTLTKAINGCSQTYRRKID